MKSIKNHRTYDSFVTLCQHAEELCKQCGICIPSQSVSYGSLDSSTAEETQSPAPSRPKRSVKVVPSLRDYLITTTLGQREEISASSDINISTSGKNRPIISPWYNQLYLPVCDLLIEQLEFRFDSDSLTMAKAVGAVLCCDNRGIQPLVQQYASVLQVNLHLLESEMELFSSTDHSINLDVIQNELTEAAYPQYHRLVQLALTLPVGTASVERSFSAMRRIRNWMRLTMGQERFSSLALLNIESDLTAALDPEQLVQMDASAGNRRL
jgi:hypothetical protein